MKRVFLALILLLLAAYLCTGIYQVRAGEQAVVRRFGRVLETPRLPGLNIGLPWGLDRVDRVAVDEQRRVEVGLRAEQRASAEGVPPGQVLTGDSNLLDLHVTVFYRVTGEDPGAAAQYVLNRERIDPLLQRAGESTLAQVLAGQKVDEVLLGRKQDQEGQPLELERFIQDRLVQAIRPYDLGITITGVKLSAPQVPAEIADVFLKVNQALSMKEAARSQATSSKNAKITDARNQANRITTESEVARNQRVKLAKSQADVFLKLQEKLQLTPTPQRATLVEQYLRELYLKEMGAILKSMKRTISDPKVEHTVIMPGFER